MRGTGASTLLRVALAAALPAVLLASCTDDRVSLAYGLEEGTVLSYELVLVAEVERSLEEQTQEQALVAVFDVVQEVLADTEEGGSLARFQLVPTSLTVDGRSSEPGPGQQFEVRLGPDGRVVGIGAPTGEAEEELAPLGIERLLPRLRPVLPGAEVSAGATWSSSTEFGDAGGTFSLATESRLAELRVVEGQPAALVRTTYESPVDRRERFANALAELRGSDVGAQQAWFALDGFLLSSVSDSVGTYSVTFRPPEGELDVTPVKGSLVVRLHTEMRLVGPPEVG